MFDAKVCDELNFYVYALRDPRNTNIFYVGYGQGNRCFDHIEEAQNNDLKNSQKLETIGDIHNSGNEVHIDIVRYGLDEATALEVEAALIDVLCLKGVGNQISGHHSYRGMDTAQEIQIRYGAEELKSDEPLILIKINGLYEKGMTIDQVYEAARWCWRLDINRVRKAKYVLAVAHGIVRGVFGDLNFQPVSKGAARHEREIGRVYFTGTEVPASQYLNKSVKAFGKVGEANPIRYVNI